MTLEEHTWSIIEKNEKIEQAIKREFLSTYIPKGNLIFKEGQVARNIFYIEKGLARMYYSNDSGKDITYGFFAENNYVSPSQSFFEQTPSLYNIELLEDSQLRYISFDGLERLLSEFSEIERVKSYILSLFLYQANRRIVSLQFYNAQQRYEELEKSQTQILQRASLGHIASYLGITQETLSRIRSKK